jgi:hypothetical protein
MSFPLQGTYNVPGAATPIRHIDPLFGPLDKGGGSPPSRIIQRYHHTQGEQETFLWRLENGRMADGLGCPRTPSLSAPGPGTASDIPVGQWY